MLFSQIGRSIIFSFICMFLLCGCSGGGGSPVTTPFTEQAAQSPTSDRDGCYGSAEMVNPPLAWEITQPADLIEEGWGLIPATVSDTITFSAFLYGRNITEFNGEVDLKVDGNPYEFKFAGNVITAQINGLEQGRHHIHVVASSNVGCTSQSFRFEVVNSPPTMRIGIGEEDGKIYAVLSRRMPVSQLADISKWSCDGFNAVKQNIQALSDNCTVVLEMSSTLSFHDLSWLPGDEFSPSVEFNSSLGNIRAVLLNGISSNNNPRSGQYEPPCDKGDTYDHVSQNHCDPEKGWVIERDYLISQDSESRAVFNAEIPIGLAGFSPAAYPWRDCFNLVVVRFNSVSEGHWDPGIHWDEDYDELCHASQSEPYFGAGFNDWYGVHYYRDFSYYPPSGCNYGWWSFEVDCHWCDHTEPYGMESKGSHTSISQGSPIFVDHDPPFFGYDGGGEEGIRFILSEAAEDFVLIDLLEELNQLGGVVYTAGGTAVSGMSSLQLQAYFNSHVGQFLEADGLCLIAVAQDTPSAQGRYINSDIFADYVYQDENYMQNLGEHFFYVDLDPLAQDEYTSELWPELIGGELYFNPKPIDGDPMGELSVWVMAPECVMFSDYTSCRLRAVDIIENWRRSDELALAEHEVEVTVEVPAGTSCGDHVIAGSPVEFKAEIVGSDAYDLLEPYFQWYVLKWDEGLQDWVEYGPHCDQNHQYSDSGYGSVIHEDEDWEGEDFKLEAIYDEEFHVRAKIARCGFAFWGDCMVYDDPAFEIRELMFIDETYTEIPGSFLPGRRVQCDDGPGVTRENGDCILDIYVLVTGDVNYAPEVVWVDFSANGDQEGQPGIHVPLFRLDPGSGNSGYDYDFIRDEFEYSGSESQDQWHIYCRGVNVLYLGTRTFYGPVYASDSSRREPTSLNDTQNAYLYVTSREDAYPEGSEDIKDYSVVIGDLVHPNPEDHDWDNFMPTLEPVHDDLYYGSKDSIRVKYWSCHCSPYESQNNSKRNVLTFGQEYVTAVCSEQQGLSAVLAVESEADVLFVISHGYCDLNSESSSLFLGSDNEIFANDWQNNEFELNRDAKWLVTTACFTLAKDYEIYDHTYDFYDEWKDLINSSDLEAIAGHGAYHRSHKDEPEKFWEPFILRLNNDSYSGHNGYWVNNDVPDGIDHLVLTYMETASEYMNGIEEDFVWGVGLTPDHYNTWAAIDGIHYYYLERSPTGYKIYGASGFRVGCISFGFLRQPQRTKL